MPFLDKKTITIINRDFTRNTKAFKMQIEGPGGWTGGGFFTKIRNIFRSGGSKETKKKVGDAAQQLLSHTLSQKPGLLPDPTIRVVKDRYPDLFDFCERLFENDFFNGSSQNKPIYLDFGKGYCLVWKNEHGGISISTSFDGNLISLAKDGKDIFLAESSISTFEKVLEEVLHQIEVPPRIKDNKTIPAKPLPEQQISPSIKSSGDATETALHPKLSKLCEHLSNNLFFAGSSREKPIYLDFGKGYCLVWKNEHGGISISSFDGKLISLSKDWKDIYLDNKRHSINESGFEVQSSLKIFEDVLSAAIPQIDPRDGPDFLRDLYAASLKLDR